MWSVLDLKDAFSQIPLAPEARPIFKITTPLGDWQPTVCHKVTKMLPQFSKGRWIFLDPVSHNAKAYFDDVIVGSDEVED